MTKSKCYNCGLEVCGVYAQCPRCSSYVTRIQYNMEDVPENVQDALCETIDDSQVGFQRGTPCAPPRPLDVQVGGVHYKDFSIQPVEFCQKNKIPYCEANVIKYVSRHRQKNGIEDLKKAKHYIDLIIQMEYNEDEW